MKNILLIGVGGTGSSAVDILYQKIHDLGNLTDNHITALVFDTDAGSVANITAATNIPMSDPASVGTVCDRLGRENLKEWFPTDDNSVMAQEMSRGASQWRKKSFLAFLNLMNKTEMRGAFHRAMENMTKAGPNAAYEIYVIASIAGGTGSGSFIPIALYAQRFLRMELGKSAQCFAVIACPDIYVESQTESNKVKIYANAYAILRELNAINLVARGHNRDCNKEKKPLIKFRIGSKNEPNVGLLFDAEDERFWRPEAAPFRQVYILDKVPGVHSVRSHEIILANALYSTLCTGIGKELDSELSNHENQVNQSNGSNAIYAGISSAQVTFPLPTILDYLAHEKTLESCRGEWLTLHKETEDGIQESEKEARENHQRFSLKEGDYAKRFLTSLENELEKPHSPIADILYRGTLIPPKKEGEKPTERLDLYTAILDQELAASMPKPDSLLTQVGEFSPIPTPGFLAGKAEVDSAKESVIAMATEMETILKRYFRQCVEKIRNASSSISNSILPMDAGHTDPTANTKLSLVHHLLSRNGKNYIHPVAAMIQLCRMKRYLMQQLASSSSWEAVRTGKAETLPTSVLRNSATVRLSGSKVSKSFYISKLTSARLTSLLTRADEYRAAKTNTEADSLQLREDAAGALKAIYDDASAILRDRVLGIISQRLDVLIDEYRSFFSRFSEAKRDLEEQTRAVKRRDCGRAGTVLNVFSSEEDKARVLKAVGTGGESDEDVLTADHAAGLGVFTSVFEAAVASNDPEHAAFSHKGSRTLTALFQTMTDSHRKILLNNSDFKSYVNMNVIEAMVRTCEDPNDSAAVTKELEKAFAHVKDLANPSLRVSYAPDGSSVMPSELLTLILMSYPTAQYIKRNADFFGLEEPVGVSEQNMIAACVEQFVHRFIAPNARHSIVKGIPDYSLYVTGEILDITPLRISKFDEMSENPVYFTYYQKALENYKKHDTDMWNPHLGFNLHKRGFLPYMNARMEDYCDEKVSKALLFGVLEEKIKFKSPHANESPCFCYTDESGDTRAIKASNRKSVNKKNIALLFDWLRNNDELVDSWSDSFEKAVTEQLHDLPLATTESEYSTLKGRITEADYVKGIRQGIFRKRMSGRKSYDYSEAESILEFAYEIKCNEETMHDCDDADRLLKVAFDTLCRFCEFRAPFSALAGSYVSIYNQQLSRFAQDVLNSLCQKRSADRGKEEMREFANRLFSWAGGLMLFCPVDTDEYETEDGKINYLRNTSPIDHFSIAEAPSAVSAKPASNENDGGADTSDGTDSN